MPATTEKGCQSQGENFQPAFPLVLPAQVPGKKDLPPDGKVDVKLDLDLSTKRQRSEHDLNGKRKVLRLDSSMTLAQLIKEHGFNCQAGDTSFRKLSLADVVSAEEGPLANNCTRTDRPILQLKVVTPPP